MYTVLIRYSPYEYVPHLFTIPYKTGRYLRYVFSKPPILFTPAYSINTHCILKIPTPKYRAYFRIEANFYFDIFV